MQAEGGCADRRREAPARPWPARAAGPSLLIAAAIALLAGCVAAPAACVDGPAGRVCASTPELAADGAARIERIVTALRATLPGLRDVPLDVWLQPRPQILWFVPLDPTLGAVYNSWTGRIHATEGHRDLDVALAHEVVHALLDGSWSELPATLEEGLCDQMAARIADGGPRLRADRLLRAAAAAGGPPMFLRLETPDGGWSEHALDIRIDVEPGFDLLNTFSRSSHQVHVVLGPRDRAVWYGTAFVAAGRILALHGPQGLRDLCRATRDDDADRAIATLSAAAELSSTPAPWHAAILAELDEETAVDLARLIAPELAQIAHSVVALRSDFHLRSNAVLDSRPSFRVRGADPVVELAALPEFREIFESDTRATP